MKTLYRNFSGVNELNAEYDIEASVPDFGVYVTQFTEQSAAAREALPSKTGVRFGPTLAEYFDVFYPPDAKPDALRPTLYFIHGGYWKVTNSDSWSYVARGLCERGWTVIVENYALCPQVSMTEIVRQHRAGFCYAWQNAAALGIDRDRIVIAGHSAGGHGAAWLIATDWADDYGLPAQPMCGVLGVSGLYDLRPLPRTFVAPELGLEAGEAAEMSPFLHIPAKAPRCIWAYGAKETAEFRRQTADFAACWNESGLGGKILELPNNHFDILDRLADGESELAKAVIELSG